MTAEQNELRIIVESVIDQFNEKESYLLERDVSERCICARFARYLETKVSSVDSYSEYVADVEYNRGANENEYEPKRFPDSQKTSTVDLAVHKRGYNHSVHHHGERNVVGFSNLICIEMKKYNNSPKTIEAIELDKNRLKVMTYVSSFFGYTIGFMINIQRNGLSIAEICNDGNFV